LPISGAVRACLTVVPSSFSNKATPRVGGEASKDLQKALPGKPRLTALGSGKPHGTNFLKDSSTSSFYPKTREIDRKTGPLTLVPGPQVFLKPYS
jgi:hypothetical protein